MIVTWIFSTSVNKFHQGSRPDEKNNIFKDNKTKTYKTKETLKQSSMVKKFLYGMKSIAMFEPYASELTQFYHDNRIYNDKLFYIPFSDDIDMLGCSTGTEITR